MTDTNTPLVDGNLCLRRPRMDDADAWFEAGNDPEIQHMYGVPKDNTPKMTVESATRHVSNHVGRELSWFIDIDGQLSGEIFLHGRNTHDQRATLAMGLLRAPDLGKGYGTRALRLMLDHAFDVLRLHRISLRVLSYNARAIAAYRKVGFVQEGVERQSARVGDAWHDDVMMALLAPDWRAAR